MLRPLWLPQLMTPHKPSRTSTWYRKQRYSSSTLIFPSQSAVLEPKSDLKRFVMATSTSLSPSGALVGDPVSQPRSIAQPSPTDFFEHEPLDHSQPSIRLLKISPTLSTEGLIQCSITHTTIDHAPYRCLSYAWGKPERKQLVLMNGKRFYVQPNLFGFLIVTRANTARTVHQYWIDAVCINQNNTAERNHQVMQMGRIYTEAETVIAWLGLSSRATVFLDSWKISKKISSSAQQNVVFDELADNEYWTRAWITQELILARSIIVAIGSLTFTFDELLEMIRDNIYHCFADYKKSRLVLSFDRRSKIVGLPLAQLLLNFCDKNCSNPRDRIFSLLALCAEKHHIKVDYGCSVLELVWSIMKSSANTFCACSALIVMQSLAPEIAELIANANFRYDWGPLAEIDVDATDLEDLGGYRTCEVLNYVLFHAFDAVPTPPPANNYTLMPEKEQPFGSSFARIDGGLGRIRISFWYLYELCSNGGRKSRFNELCSRPWTGTNECMASIRVGYGNWNINAPMSPAEELPEYDDIAMPCCLATSD